MNVIRLITGLIALAFIAPPALQAAADTDPFSNRVLSGMGPVAVHVDGVESKYRRYGLDAARLRAGIEQRLRAAGVPVIDAAELPSNPNGGMLQLRLRMVQSTYFYYSYSLNLQASQKLALAGGGDAYVLQPVWSEGTNGTLLPDEVQRLEIQAAQLVDQFIHDYAVQNAAGR